MKKNLLLLRQSYPSNIPLNLVSNKIPNKKIGNYDRFLTNYIHTPQILRIISNDCSLDTVSNYINYYPLYSKSIHVVEMDMYKFTQYNT